MSATTSTPAAPLKQAVIPRNIPAVVHYDDDDEDEVHLAPAAPAKADWRNNPFIPLGAFGGAVALGVGIVVARRNAGWGMSQTIMQARVIAQAACVGGLIGIGAYSAYTAKKDQK